MDQPIDAIYENGVLRLPSPLADFKNGQSVRVVIFNPEDEKQRQEAVLRYMQARGMIVNYSVPENVGPAVFKFKPIAIKGEPLSETIIKERGPR